MSAGFIRSTHASPLPRLAALLVVMLCGLLATGCSVVGTVYGQLDLILASEADRWLDLDRAQKARLRAALASTLERHRTEELPDWIALMREVAAQVEGDPAPADLLASIERSRHLLDRTTALVLAPLGETLAELQPAQVEHLEREMAEDNLDYAEEFLHPSSERRATSRAKRTREAIERWSGRLDPGQRERVERLMSEIPDGSEAWQAYRLAWQASLLARLRAGTDAASLERLLADWWIGDAGVDPGYAEQMSRNRHVVADALAELIGSFSPAQRQRAAGRLRDAAEALEATLEPA